MDNEWAQTVDDVLWRRSKFGLTATADERQAIGRFMALFAEKPRQPAS